MHWLANNYQWLLGGVAGTAIVALLGFVLKRWLFPSTPTGPTAAVTAGQIAANNSPIATGSGIIQTVNAPSLHVNVGSTALPDVLLQCNWTSMLGAGPVAILPGGSGWVVRQRFWALSAPGGGPLYNVRIGDIDFGGVIAHFVTVDVLTGAAVFSIPRLFDASSKMPIIVHDLETLITHPPPECDIKRYTNPTDPLDVQIPIAVTYSDAQGSKYRVDYVFKYDVYLEEGRIIRKGGIKKI